ncbi:MAG: hypothetical protein WDN28_14225 [Chthoniobacter sp.]
MTIQIASGYQLRMVGAHLKSKLPTPEGEALVRRNEALLLRKHLDEIPGRRPHVRLVCLGDFNDLKNEPAYHEITRRPRQGLHDRAARPGRTGRYLDRILAGRGPLPRASTTSLSARPCNRDVLPGSARVYRSPSWNQASDHRAVFATIVPHAR